MTLTHRPDTAVALDPDDQLPIWDVRPGAELVPRVRAHERLGVGHRCETWLGLSLDLWAPVVVKLARPHQVDHPRARRTLQREVTVLAGNLHPGLPRLYHDGTGAEIPSVLIEYVDGPALDQALGRMHLRSRAVVRLASDLLAALRTVHARGVAHLDLKPENVMLRGDWAVLVDFGSSRRIGSPQPPGRPVGTLGWAAPELEACAPVSVPMDLYGLGRVLRFALGPSTPLTRLLDPGRTRLDGLIDALTRDDPAERPDLATAYAELPR